MYGMVTVYSYYVLVYSVVEKDCIIAREVFMMISLYKPIHIMHPYVWL